MQQRAEVKLPYDPKDPANHYPKWKYGPKDASKTVNSLDEELALGEQWFDWPGGIDPKTIAPPPGERLVAQSARGAVALPYDPNLNRYPKWKHHPTLASRTVENPAAEEALGEDWSDSPVPVATPKPRVLVDATAIVKDNDRLANEVAQLRAEIAAKSAPPAKGKSGKPEPEKSTETKAA